MNDERAESRAERFLEYEKNIGPILDTLMTPYSLWHRTSLQGFRSMVNSGFILPSGKGPEHTYPQSKVSVALRMEAVSLFDFESSHRDDVLEQSRNWLAFMVDQGHPTLVLRFDRRSFTAGEIFTQDELTRDNAWPMRPLEMYGETKAYYIPSVEAWHSGPIAIEKAVDVLVVSNHRANNFELVAHSVALEKLRSEWAESSTHAELWGPETLDILSKMSIKTE